MTECCSLDAGQSTPCPRCDTTGPVVGAQTVVPHRAGVKGAWQFCPTPGCPVVYYLGTDAVDDQEVITQVADKAIDKPTPVCFCFAHTADDIANDVRANGASTIQASVKSAVASGLCACEHLNPSRSCCLPDVRRAVKEAEGSSAAV